MPQVLVVLLSMAGGAVLAGVHYHTKAHAMMDAYEHGYLQGQKEEGIRVDTRRDAAIQARAEERVSNLFHASLTMQTTDAPAQQLPVSGRRKAVNPASDPRFADRLAENGAATMRVE